MPTVRIFADLRQLANVGEAEIPGDTLRSVVAALCSRYPLLGERILEAGSLRPQFLVTLNGYVLELPKKLDVAVQADDHIAIFPPIAGG